MNPEDERGRAELDSLLSELRNLQCAGVHEFASEQNSQ